MRPSTTIIALLAPLGCLAKVEVAFFSDQNCQNYLGTTYGDENTIGGGGPAGSFSAYYVTRPRCIYSSCAFFKGSPDGNREEAMGCFGSPTGVWVSAICSPSGCQNAF